MLTLASAATGATTSQDSEDELSDEEATVSVLLDTGIVYAYYDRSDRWHAQARALVERERNGLVLPAPVIPEVDHLLGRRLGARSQLTFYGGIVDGTVSRR